MAKQSIRLSDHFTYGKLLRFTLPSICMMVFTSIYGVVDGLFVSNFVGKTPFAAVNLVMPFVMILGGMGFMIGTGGTALVSKLLGEGKQDEAHRTFSMLVLFTLLLGVVLSAVGILTMPAVSRLLGASDAMMPDCILYGRIVTGFTFAFMLQNVFQSFFIAAEKPRLGLFVTVAAGVTNMVLDALFIAVFDWGVAGAAIATVLSQIASCVIGFAYMHRRYALLRFSLRELRMDLKTAGRILQVGAPMAIQQSIVSCGFLFLQRLVNYYGESMIASYTVASRMENILMIPIIGIQNTMATFAGQNMGAQRPDRVSKGLGQGVLVSLGMTLIFLICAVLAMFTGKKMNPLRTVYDAVNSALPVMGILMGVGMFIQVMTLTGVRGLIVTSCLSLPSFARYLALAISMPAFGAISSFGSASVLGVPFLLSFLAKDQIIVAAALSLVASLGDMVPPTALAGIFAAKVVGMENYTPILKKCRIPCLIVVIWAILFIVFADHRSFLTLS